MRQMPVLCDNGLSVGRLIGLLSLFLAASAALVVLLCPASGLAAEPEGAVMYVNPAKGNVVRFAPLEARFVRFVIDRSGATATCIDELEIYAPAGKENLALAKRGAKATASSCLEGNAAHRVEHLNDGQYGNARSWIAAAPVGWAQIELPEPATIDRVVFSRDRRGQYADRMPAAFQVQVSRDGQTWQLARRVADARVLVPEVMLLLPYRPTVLDFPATEARMVRLVIHRTNGGQPCIDELEVYGEDEKRNLALSSAGGKASASSCIEGHDIHKVEHLNDGQYGNDRSWIAAGQGAWAQIELPALTRVRRLVFSRDRKRRYRDRFPNHVEVQLSRDGVNFQPVKIVRANTDLPLHSPVPGEEPRDWAERIVMAMPAAMHKVLLARLDEIETHDDARSLLDLFELNRRRDVMRKRLELEFNPAAIRRAAADLSATFGKRYSPPERFAASLAKHEGRLEEVRQMLDAGDGATIRRGMAACEELFAFQRRVLLANPLLDFEEILLLKRKTPRQSGDTYWRWGQKYGMTVNWSCDFRPKNPPVADWWDESLVARPVRGDKEPRTIFKAQPTHMIQQPELHFDADRILFAMPGPRGAFQVFQINVDGSGLKQITHDTGPDIDNGDPCYLPDGQIIFNSTRMFTGVPCEDGNSYVSGLCLTDAEGRSTRMLCFDQESNWHPSLLNNGRVLYTRYEYANISHQFGRLLFHMNPDGTNQMEYYGSNSYWPNSIFYARAIPDHPTMVVGVVCGHHGPNKTGRLVLFDPAKGRRETSGALQTIPGHGKPVERIVADVLYGNDWPKFVHPWPLSDKYFLVSARLHPEQTEYAIYLVDVFDNMTELCRLPDYSLLEPIPLKPRARPPVVPNRVRPGAKHATVYLANVYAGRGLEGVPKGSVKRLRLFTYNYVYRHSGRGGFGHLATPGVDGPWEPRAILGSVPVREDGSAVFRVPANTPIAVQPIDQQGRALQVMRSWFTAMPGEVLSCVGCHERQNTTPPSAYTLAATGRPAEIEPWRGPARGFDFELEVQPVLDKYCVGCHDGTKADRPDLARKSNEEKLRINRAYHASTESHITTTLTPAFIALHPYVRRPHAEDNYGLQVVAEYFADTSPLVQMLVKGHHNVKLDAEAWDRLQTWIDLGAPDMGSWKNSEWGVAENYHQRRLEMLERYAGRSDDVEWMPDPPKEIAPFVPPEADKKATPAPECPGWPFDAAAAARRQKAVGLPVTMTLRPVEGVSIELALVPPGEFVMGDPQGASDERPLARVRIRKPFYMSRHEVTNAQFAALIEPAHSSGIIGWRSIDWRGEGYHLTAPDQPAVRVSWLEAVEFCKALSAKTGSKATLPSEVQWEWACRAGSAEPVWYGQLDDSFAGLENLAGREQRGFAFHAKRKWYLRDDRFDDGQMITAPVGSFRANPWGLFDMAGNVREWTRSTYRPYPYDPTDGREALVPDGEKVVRGGSWHERPRDARSGYRWKYPSWRKVFNVGFRVIVEPDR